jgi:hypothetical protein
MGNFFYFLVLLFSKEILPHLGLEGLKRFYFYIPKILGFPRRLHYIFQYIKLRHTLFIQGFFMLKFLTWFRTTNFWTTVFGCDLLDLIMKSLPLVIIRLPSKAHFIVDENLKRRLWLFFRIRSGLLSRQVQYFLRFCSMKRSFSSLDVA